MLRFQVDFLSQLFNHRSADATAVNRPSAATSASIHPLLSISHPSCSDNKVESYLVRSLFVHHGRFHHICHVFDDAHSVPVHLAQ